MALREAVSLRMKGDSYTMLFASDNIAQINWTDGFIQAMNVVSIVKKEIFKFKPSLIFSTRI